jgi:selenocysteine-specific elongation factor
MIIGTAGHIDHGKSALVRALTGTDPDRWEEEKARGITLDLGYAYATLDDGTRLGFVDVPGHERLVHNMLAGATGIDFVLLVIAADDGPMPQTREHLEIIDLLGLGRGAVALNKCDLVDAARLAEVEVQIAGLLHGTRLAGAPVFPLSSVTGEGLDALRAHLAAEAALTPSHDGRGRFRLAVDRAFVLKGTGVVVTGTAHSGTVAVDERLVLSPRGLEVRVRGIHAQNAAAERGVAGQRCALNLTGPRLDKDSVGRGDWLVAPELHAPSDRLDVELQVARHAGRPLQHWTPVHVHLGAARLTGRVAVLEGEALEPGATGLVQLVLDAPTLAVRGDRVILRDQSARQTLGGGRVLDDAPPTRGRRSTQRLAVLRALGHDDPLEALVELVELVPGGIDLARYERLWNLDATAAARLHGQPTLVEVPGPAGPVAFSPQRWESLQSRLLATLAAEHEQHPERLGPDRERLRRLTDPSLPRPVFAALIDALIAGGQVAVHGALLHLPSHSVKLTVPDQKLWNDDVFPILRAHPYNPPRVRDVARSLGLDEERVRRLCKTLVAQGELFLVAHDHYFPRESVAELAAILRDLNECDGEARAANFRDRIGTGRKVAIQILEFFDRIGMSRRIGDSHRLFQDSLMQVR